MQKIRVPSFDGTQLVVSSEGEGPALVLCDGIGCDGYIWRYVREEFKNQFRIVHWQYRGHGESDPPADPTAIDIEALRRDLLAVLDAMQVERGIFLGHSMGVQLVLDFVLEHPERVSAQVLMCGSYGRPLDTFHDNGILAAVFPSVRKIAARYPHMLVPLWKSLLRSELTYQLATTIEVNGKLLKPDDFRPYFEHMATMDPQLFINMLAHLGNHSVEERLGEVRAPTIVVAGQKDSFTPAWLSHRMQRLIPGAELLIVPSGTHTAPLEIPELINLRLRRFFTEHLDLKPPRRRARVRTPRAPK